MAHPLPTPTATEQAELDDALDDTFPASDPPSMTDPTHGLGSPGVDMDEAAIADRAYDIWQEAGSPHGSHEEHWSQARRELQDKAGTASPAGSPPLTPTTPEEIR